MDPASVEQAIFNYRLALFILAGANLAGALASVLSALGGLKPVRRHEFDEHKLQMAERFNGLAKKLNDGLANVEQGQDEILRELRDFAKTLGRHEGKLEGLGK